MRELLAHHRVLDDLGERRHRADLEAAVGLADAVSSLIWPRSTTTFGLLEAVLQPVHAVEAAGQHQRVGAVLSSSLSASSIDRRLVQLEHRHYVANHRHSASLYCGLRIADCGLIRNRNPQSAIRDPQSHRQMCAVSGSCVRLPPFSSAIRIMSAVTGARRNTSSPTASAIAFRTAP